MHNQTNPSLLPLFTEAFMAEQKRYVVGSPNDSDYFEVWLKEPPWIEPLITGTHADCERFVVDRCARKGFEALLAEHIASREANVRWYSIEGCLHDLATEPETTSGGGA